MNLPQECLNAVETFFSDFEKIRIRDMFDGVGIYSGQDLFALVSRGNLFLKVDDTLKNELSEYGGENYSWTNPDTGKAIEMSYVSVPKPMLNGAEEAINFARSSLKVAIQARREKVKSPRRFAF